MDSKIKRLMDICNFEDDPQADLIKQIFEGINFESNYNEILDNKDKLINSMIKEANLSAFELNEETAPNLFISLKKELISSQPLIVNEELSISQYNIEFGKGPIYIAEGVSLANVSIKSKAYIDSGVNISNCMIKDSKTSTYIGANAQINNAVLKGNFISGGAIRAKKYILTHINDSLNRSIQTNIQSTVLENAIVGAYCLLTQRPDAIDFPPNNNSNKVIDPISLNTHSFQNNGYNPILVGTNSIVEARLNQGTVIGANVELQSKQSIEGMAFKFLNEDKYTSQ